MLVLIYNKLAYISKATVKRPKLAPLLFTLSNEESLWVGEPLGGKRLITVLQLIFSQSIRGTEEQ